MLNRSSYLARPFLFGISCATLLVIVACGASDDEKRTIRPNGKAGASGSGSGGSSNQASGGSAGAAKGGSSASGGSNSGNSGGSGGTNSSSAGNGGTSSGGDNGSGGAPVEEECTPGGSGFEVVGDVAIDKKTCLVWQRTDPERDVSKCTLTARNHPSALCWSAASDYCEELELGGHSDFRLPTPYELKTIVVAENSPAIDKDTFPNAVAFYYWTSLEKAGAKIVCLDFSNAGKEGDAGKDGPQPFRCVRGTAK